MVFGRSKPSFQTNVVVETSELPPPPPPDEEPPPILGGLSIQHSGSRLQAYNGSGDGGDNNNNSVAGDSLRVVGQHDDTKEDSNENRPNSTRSARSLSNMSTSFRKKVSIVRETIHHDNSKQKIIRWAMCFLALLSTIFAYVGLTGCSFMLVGSAAEETEDNNSVNTMDANTIYLGYGLFNEAFYHENDKRRGCLPYLQDFKEEYVSDPAFNASRTFSISTVLLESIGFGLLTSMLLFYRPKPESKRKLLWNIMKCIFGVCILSQLFTFSVFASEFCNIYNNVEVECKAGPGASLASLNVFILIGVFIMSLFVPPPRHPLFMIWDTRLLSPEDDDANYNAKRRGSDELRTEIYATERDPNDSGSDNNNVGVEVVAGDTFDMLDETPTPRNRDDDTAENGEAIRPSDYDARSVIKAAPSMDEGRAPQAASSAAYGNDVESTLGSLSTATAFIAADAPSVDVNSGISPLPTSKSYRGSFDQTPTVQTETQIVPEGKKTIETVTHPDGSRTVTTTLERFSDVDDNDKKKHHVRSRDDVFDV